MDTPIAVINLWTNDGSWLWALIQALAVVVSLFFISRQIRIQTATHVVQSLSTINARWNSDTMIRARFDVCSRCASKRFEFDGVADYVAEFLEELGMYLKIRAVSPEQMWQAQSWYIEHYYWMFKEGIEQVRSEHKDESLYTGFESLFATMTLISKRHRAPTFRRSPEDLLAFAKSELSLAGAFLSLRKEEPNSERSAAPERAAGRRLNKPVD